MVNTIRFSKNFNNKLAGDYFTTIRTKDESRYRIGETFTVFLQNQIIFYAELVDIQHMYLRDIDEFSARLDAAMSAVQFKDLIKNFYKGHYDFEKQMVSRLLFKRLPNQKDLHKKHTAE